MDLNKFKDCTPKPRTPRKANLIFLTLKPGAIVFSRHSCQELAGVARVRFLINREEKQILVHESEDGMSFMPEGKRGSMVVWYKKDLIEKIKEMTGEDNIRVYGDVVEVEGKRGLLFDCNDIGGMRGA